MAHNFNYALKTALDKNQFYLVYQGIIDSEQTVIGYEAFLRWDDQALDTIPRSMFWDLLEVSDEISSLTNWFFNQLKKDLKDNENLRSHKIFLNLSFGQLCTPGLHINLQALKEVIDLEHIVFDISETTLMKDIQLIKHHMTQLKQYGVTFALDDFGAGCSSLIHLKILPLSYLKVDHLFIGNVDTSSTDLAIVKACVELAKAMGLKSLAEGVETKSQLEQLKLIGIDLYQGHYFQKPITKDAF